MPSTLVDGLADDLLAEILLYNDFSTAYTLCHFVSKSMRQRIQRSSQESDLGHVWKLMYDRQHFAPVENYLHKDVEEKVDYLTEIWTRRRLLYNLLQSKRSKRKHSRPCCFNLPNRCFFFKPIVPSDFDTEEEDEHGDQFELGPPPVVYECDSFVLTSCGTSPELLLLDPFDGRLSVIPDITTHCVASDEAVMERAMFQAADAIVQVPRSRDFEDWKDNEIAGHCFEESVVRNHLRHRHQSSPPSQELLTQDDVFSLDISSYFSFMQGGDNPSVTESHEFDLICQGVDSKPILDPHTKQFTGLMVGLGRTVTSVDDMSAGCTELSLWAKNLHSEYFEERLVCRYPWSVGYLDFDPIQRRVFANKSHGSEASPYDAETVVVYPLIPWMGDGASYFPSPLGTLKCRHSVVILVVDSLGKMLFLGTEGGTIEIWDVSGPTTRYKRLFELSVVDSLRQAINEWIADRVRALKISSDDGDDDDDGSQNHFPSTTQFNGYETAPLTEEEVISFKVLKRQPDLPVFQNGVDYIFLPKHLSADQGGFVTLHYHSVEGSSLLLWRKRENEFKVVSLINLRLSSRQKPRIHYDGNRLLVFGQDHIGVIILVYHVANGDNQLPSDDDTTTGEHSGGVYNLTDQPELRFASRIRHAALGGIDRLDTIHMTANERFIIVNTKTGNLLGEVAPSLPEGLLVIDLQDQGRLNNKG